MSYGIILLLILLNAQFTNCCSVEMLNSIWSKGTWILKNLLNQLLGRSPQTATIGTKQTSKPGTNNPNENQPGQSGPMNKPSGGMKPSQPSSSHADGTGKTGENPTSDPKNHGKGKGTNGPPKAPTAPAPPGFIDTYEKDCPQTTETDIKEWNMDAYADFNGKPHTLPCAMLKVMQARGLISKDESAAKIPSLKPMVLVNSVERLSEEYSETEADVPFCTISHAIDTIYALNNLMVPELEKIITFTPVEMLALFLAGAGLCAGRDGYSNAFIQEKAKINAQGFSWAKVNARAIPTPNEDRSKRLTLDLLQENDEKSPIKDMKEEDRVLIREIIEQMILATGQSTANLDLILRREVSQMKNPIKKMTTKREKIVIMKVMFVLAHQAYVMKQNTIFEENVKKEIEQRRVKGKTTANDNALNDGQMKNDLLRTLSPKVEVWKDMIAKAGGNVEYLKNNFDLNSATVTAKD